ncbi:hypothetical protein AVEN_154977-2-1, partial [Araneus ventricosus]
IRFAVDLKECDFFVMRLQGAHLFCHVLFRLILSDVTLLDKELPVRNTRNHQISVL